MTDQLQPGQHQQRSITTPTGGAPGYRLRHVKSLPPGGQRWDIVWDESQATACVWDGQQWICFSTGAGADCMFDYLVSSCFGDLLGFTEGQVFTSGPGCTFKGFSTVQGMYTAANGQGHRTAYVCGDNYNENPTINLASGDRLWVFGAGSRRTVIVGTHTLTNDGEGLYFQNIGFGSASVAYRTTDIFTSADVNPDIDFNHCWLAGRFSCDATSFRFVDCDFQHGFLWHTQNTDQVMVYSSTIGDNGTNAIDISVSGDFRFEGIQLNRPALISAATCNGRFIAVKFGTSGTSQNWLRFNNNTAGRWMVDNCQFATPLDANGAIYIESVSGNFEIAIIASKFEKAAGSAFPFITSADAAARAIVVGNMFLRDSTGDYVEDDLGVSISGSFTNSVFGPNYPATKARYNIAGADNEFYPGSSASGTSVPTNTDHDDLTNVTPDQHHTQSHAHDGVDGSGTVDAADVTYTPADVNEWPNLTDPGNVDGSLDSLAATRWPVVDAATPVTVGPTGTLGLVNGKYIYAISANSGTTDDVTFTPSGLDANRLYIFRAAAGHTIRFPSGPVIVGNPAELFITDSQWAVGYSIDGTQVSLMSVPINLLNHGGWGFKTIAGGVINVADVGPVGSSRFWDLAAETGTADLLDTVDGMQQNSLYGFSAALGHTITIRHGVGNIQVIDGQDLVLTGDVYCFAQLNVTETSVVIFGFHRDRFVTNVASFHPITEGLASGSLWPIAGHCVGEAGEHGTYTALRAKAKAGTAGVGTTTIVVEADDSPAFSTPTTLFTLALDANTEVDDTVLDNAWAVGDIHVRARCTALGGTPPKEVVVEFYYKQRAEEY